MIIGFTGTQIGMTALQKEIFENLICGLKGEFHHGDCIGADAEAHDIAEKYLECVIHPPIISAKRAFKKANRICETLNYLARNKAIVIACERMIATPKEFAEQVRSGTWSTIRYAKNSMKSTMIIFPDGSQQVV